MEAKISVLLADASGDLRLLLRETLESTGEFQVVGETGDGGQVLALVEETHPQLLLLDAMLPGMDGFTLLRELRGGGSSLPVLMLTARSDLSDRVRGLDCGADYYLTKPFETEELLACIRSLLRRGGETADSGATVFGDLHLQQSTFLLSCGDRSVRLSRREYDLMELLMRNPNRVYSRETLLDAIWGYDVSSEIRTVDVHIRRLREKLEGVSDQWCLKTVWGVGYKFEVKE